MNATACSQSGCSDLAPAPELCPFGTPAAATSPCRAFMNKPYPFLNSHLISFLLNLTHTTGENRAGEDREESGYREKAEEKVLAGVRSIRSISRHDVW